MKKIPLLCMFLLCAVNAPMSFANNGFAVEDIRFEGLQRISVEKMTTLLPFQRGTEIDDKHILIRQAIQALFATGDFDDVQISRGIGQKKNTLFISVVERPIINKITINGNNVIPTEQLEAGLKRIGLAKGETLQKSAVTNITKELTNSYIGQGRYGAGVEVKTEALSRNRVDLIVDIKEGTPIKIANISLQGNEKISTQDIMDAMQLRQTQFWSFFKGKNKYARERLAADLDNVNALYQSRGFLQYQLRDVQIVVAKDMQTVDIAINIDEGDVFTVGEVTLLADASVKSDLQKLVQLKAGEVFNQTSLNNSQKLIEAYLNSRGFYNAEVSVSKAESAKGALFADAFIMVKTGKPVYVRRIAFVGNAGTNDEVLRREMRQLEGAIANKTAIELSKSRLARLGYIGDVNVETIPVEGVEDQVDLKVSVSERPSGQFAANLGFSSGSGLVYGLNVSNSNFFGTGNSFSLGANKSDSRTSVNLSFDDPYFTSSGISRGWGLFYSKTNLSEIDQSTQNWQVDRLGGFMSFGYPLSEVSRVSYRLGIEQNDITAGSASAIDVSEYLAEKGNKFLSLTSSINWRRNTLNSGFLPTSGSIYRLGAELAMPGSTETYYMLNASAKQYFELSDNKKWAFKLRGDFGLGGGYGSSDKLPFYKNYFAGGLGSIRGYQTNSLGPKSPAIGTKVEQDDGTIIYNDSVPNALGGNLSLEFGAELIFPFPYISRNDNIRTTLFLEGGNVFQYNQGALHPAAMQAQDPFFNTDELRYGAGIGLTWITMLGPLTFSYGWALNEKENDRTERFQFTLGQTF